MYTANVVVMQVIEQGLQNLRNNPDELQFILCNYASNDFVKKTMGLQYIKQATDLIMGRVPGKNLVVQPGFNDNEVSNYSLSIYTSGSEEQQVLGDFGEEHPRAIEPTVYFTLTPISATTNSLLFDNSKNIAGSMWLEQRVVQKPCGYFSKITGILIHSDTNQVEVLLGTPVPLDANGNFILTPYTFQSAVDTEMVMLGFSRDSVNMICQLRTTSHREIHELFLLVVRYCFKFGRLTFEENGYEVPTFAYSPPSPTYETEDVAFMTIFTATMKANDFWIMSKTRPPAYFCEEVDVTDGDVNNPPADSLVPILTYGGPPKGSKFC